ncbi:MAG: hypothetical protein AB1798_19675, partial [Spirochaetota bacterium]
PAEKAGLIKYCDLKSEKERWLYLIKEAILFVYLIPALFWDRASSEGSPSFFNNFHTRVNCVVESY